MPLARVCSLCGRRSIGRRCRTCEAQRTRTRQTTEPWRHIYTTRAWRRVRGIALARAHHRCQHCGTSHRPEVHHKVPLVDGGAPYDLTNIEVLCGRCHRRADHEPRTPPLFEKTARKSPHSFPRVSGDRAETG